MDEESLGWDGERFAFAMVDAATRWHACAPSAGKPTHEVTAALADLVGPRANVEVIRSDNAPELIAAAESLGWIRESPAPRASETNAIAERAVRTVVEGARTLLSQARLAPAMWPHAVRHCCFAMNTRVVDGDSAWHRRYGKRTLPRCYHALWRQSSICAS